MNTLVLQTFSTIRAAAAPLAGPIDLELQTGTITALIGPNGAGKTSLLRGLAGVLPSTGSALLRSAAGSLHVDRLPPPARALHLAYLPQGRPRTDGLTVREFMHASLAAHASSLLGLGVSHRRRADAALSDLGATHLTSRRFDSLSGGEAARVALSATIALGAPWLLLDEPVASADIAAARELYRRLRDLCEERQLGCLVVEHDLGLARSWATHAVLLSAGQLAASGGVATVIPSPALAQAYGTQFAVHEESADSVAVVAVDAAPVTSHRRERLAPSPEHTR